MRESLGQIMAGVERDQSVKPRIIANNTVEYRRPDGCRVIRLHHTDILVFSPDDKRVVIDMAGWNTVTTRDRINRYAPVRVYQDRGRAYLHTSNGGIVPFFDGIACLKCPDTGVWIVEGQSAKKAQKEDQRQSKITAQIKKFVDKLDKLDKPPMPSAGDCFMCQFSAGAEPIAIGNGHKATQYLPSRDARVRPAQRDINPDHLLSHLEEGYLHGSLIVNAMRWAGRTDFAIRLFAYDRFDRRIVKRDLRRYLRSQLGMAA